MRVLFCSTWGYGHVLPMVPLAQACLGAGHDVLWVGHEPAGRPVNESGIPFEAAGLTTHEVSEVTQHNRTQTAQLPPEERAAFSFPHMFGVWSTPSMAAQLLPLAGDWHPDLVVHEAAELASPLVAAVLGMPSVTHSFGGAVPAAFVAEAGNRLEHLWSERGLAQPSYAGCFQSGYLDICPPSVQPVDLAHIPSRQPLRPVPSSGRAVAELPPYLQPGDRPLVFLTLGTVNNDVQLMASVVRALSGLPVRVLAALGPGGDPDALGEQPPHVTVERWVPQSLVLEHCDVVVSHGGSGTFLGALGAGLPQLCLPQAADQFRNAGAGVRRGAALMLSPDSAPAEAIAGAVQRLIHEESFSAAARQVAAEIAAMPSPADVTEKLAELVAAHGRG